MEVIKRNIKAKGKLNRGEEILKPKLIITWIIGVYEKLADADEIDQLFLFQYVSLLDD